MNAFDSNYAETNICVLFSVMALLLICQRSWSLFVWIIFVLLFTEFLLRPDYGSKIVTKITIFMIFFYIGIFWLRNMCYFHSVTVLCQNCCQMYILCQSLEELLNCELRLISFLPVFRAVFLFTFCQFQNPKALLWVKVEPSHLEAYLFVYLS